MISEFLHLDAKTVCSYYHTMRKFVEFEERQHYIARCIIYIARTYYSTFKSGHTFFSIFMHN